MRRFLKIKLPIGLQRLWQTVKPSALEDILPSRLRDGFLIEESTGMRLRGDLFTPGKSDLPFNFHLFLSLTLSSGVKAAESQWISSPPRVRATG
jgi:hypothetical protein